MEKKKIEILIPCYNESSNVYEIYVKIKGIVDGFVDYDFEFLFIDNASTDGTDSVLKKIKSNFF